MPPKKGQRLLRVKTDVDYWNFGLLNPEGELNARGYVQIIRMDPDEEVESAGFFPPGSLVVFMRKQGIVGLFDIHSKKFVELWRASETEQIFDVCLWKNSVYVLEGQSRSIRCISGTPTQKWELQCELLASSSRLSITELTGTAESSSGLAPSKHAGVVLAFVGPTDSGRFHVIPLGSDPDHIAVGIEQALAQSKELASIRTFGMCPDARNLTLLVADTCRHRVLAVNWIDGHTEVICGEDKSRPASENEADNAVELKEPTSLALYEPHLIDRLFLDTNSKRLVEVGLTGGYPRNLIIADKGSHSVRRLIEMGESPAMLSLAHVRILDTLIGDGIASEAPVMLKENKVPDDLRQYRVLEPSHVSVSSRGDLTVVVGSGKAVMLACPASALATNLMIRPSIAKYYENS